MYGSYIYATIPENCVIIQGDDIRSRIAGCTLKEEPDALVSDSLVSGRRFAVPVSAAVNLFGFLPFKEVSVSVIPAVEVVPGGIPIGIKIYTDGLLVVAIDHFETENGRETSPALKAGIKAGDIITSIQGNKVTTIEEFSKATANLGNQSVKICLYRNNQEQTVTLTPEKDRTNGQYKIGAWVRDSSAGIGTLTFYRPDNGKYAALGHAIVDVDIGSVYKAAGGELELAPIVGINKGKKGTPGELNGIFIPNTESIGTLEDNNICGIYGSLKEGINPTQNQPIPIGPRSSVHTGKAQILSCISGEESAAYEIEIQKIGDSGENNSKDFLIKVTDSRLIEKTGGIVQGMSGSPIIQDGRLVGAVTHVFVNDPQRGYGIFIDKMLSKTN